MSNYRNKRILELAKEAPHCFWCNAENWGQVVACHCNLIEFGKGMGIKAADIPIAYLCGTCHELIDNPPASHHLGRMDRELMFFKAAGRTMKWLADEGYLEIK